MIVNKFLAGTLFKNYGADPSMYLDTMAVMDNTRVMEDFIGYFDNATVSTTDVWGRTLIWRLQDFYSDIFGE